MPRTTTFYRVALLVLCGAVLVSASSPAYAAGSGLPWEDPIIQIIDSLTGVVAQSILTGAVVLLGFAFAFSEGAFMRRVFGVVLGGAIALSAASIVLDLFGVAQGAVI